MNTNSLREDCDYLIDQLCYSMEFYDSKESFMATVSKETKFSSDDLGKFWDNYQKIDGITAYYMDKQDWQDWINILSNANN